MFYSLRRYINQLYQERKMPNAAWVTNDTLETGSLFEMLKLRGTDTKHLGYVHEAEQELVYRKKYDLIVADLRITGDPDKC